MSVLNCVYDSVSQILRKNVERRALFDALDVVMLAIDEIVDGGIVLESDPNAVVNRVALRSDDIPLGEQTVAQVSQLSIFSDVDSDKKLSLERAIASDAIATVC